MKMYGAGLSSSDNSLLSFLIEIDPIVPSRNVGNHRQQTFSVLERKIAEHDNLKLSFVCWMI